MVLEKFKVIFLDIDGVLSINTKERATSREFPYCLEFSEHCVSNLKEILDKTKARIVISSSWRGFVSLETIMITLASHGIRGPYVMPEDIGELPFKGWRNIDQLTNVASTPKKLDSSKIHEIPMWLDNNSEYISNYVVIDDDHIFYEDTFEKQQIVVNGSIGLSVEDSEKAIKILNKPV